MDVTCKRDSRHISNASSSDKRRKIRDLSSELDGEYWQRATHRRRPPTRLHRVAPGTPPTATVPAISEESQSRITKLNQLVVRRTFDVGLPVVFGQTSFPSPHRKQQSEETFAALQRLGEVLNPETTTLQAYEVEEPDSPPRSLTRKQPLIAPTPGDSTSTWNFVPSWEALCIGARILKQALAFPFAVARFLVDVAPETRSQARLIEAARRKQEQLLLDQWNTERSQERQPSSSPLSSPPSSLPPSDNEDSTMPAAGSSGSAAPAGSGRTSGGAGPLGTGNTASDDPNTALLAQIQELIRLELSRENRADDPDARGQALRAERQNMEAKMAAIDREYDLIQAGQWTGPTTPLSPTSIYIAAPVGGGEPVKPRFNPGDLPQILFGEDLEEWISHMDHIVTSFGELVVCPHVLHRCFANGDPMRDWYLTQPSAVHLFVTTGDGCWDRFKTLLRTRFKPDLGVMQYEADSYRRQPGESWAAFGIRKYRLLKRAYDGADEANIILKIKAVMETEVVRFCKEKTNIDGFIGELMDYDRTSPPGTRSPRWIFAPESFVPREYQPRPDHRVPSQQSGIPNVGPTAARYQKDKGKAVDRSGMDRGSRDRGGQDRKVTIQNRMNPETGKMARSYLNFQGKPVFIKRPCNICEKNGAPNQMYFSFECSRSAPTQPRTYAMDGTEVFDELVDGLHRTDSGNLTSYNFQSETGDQEVIYHQESEDEGTTNEQGNGNGGW
ncbi:hypothetical protein FN846DRAFT_994071 [Sphaerosporella brunnea]|uniref:Uncharacterized protein n=1 Tax=Sphaerosporella brunnea TaxID=1250544 RepID=A0A5J5F7A1_9PEZI|nr:hypothetical protein FN846DRAFT_994071 [Sphaerosporella brunnea]